MNGVVDEKSIVSENKCSQYWVNIDYIFQWYIEVNENVESVSLCSHWDV